MSTTYNCLTLITSSESTNNAISGTSTSLGTINIGNAVGGAVGGLMVVIVVAIGMIVIIIVLLVVKRGQKGSMKVNPCGMVRKWLV